MASISGAVGSVFGGGGGLSIGMVVGIFTAVLAVIGLAWYYFRNLRVGRMQKHRLKKMLPGLTPAYRIDVSLFTQKGDGSWTYSKDKAARIEKTDEGEKYRLLKNDMDTAPVPYDYTGTTEDGSTHVALLRSGHKEFQPIKPDFNNDGMRHDDVNMREWFAQEIISENAFWNEEEVEWWQTDMAKWISIGFVMLLILIGGGYYITKVNESIVNALNAYKGAKQFIPIAYMAWRR